MLILDSAVERAWTPPFLDFDAVLCHPIDLYVWSDVGFLLMRFILVGSLAIVSQFTMYPL